MGSLPSASWLSVVTSLDPPRGIEAPPDWDAAVRFLAENGLGSIAAYNLQYRMPDAVVPEMAKDVLLGYYQGLVNDNVFKLVTLKHVMADVTAQVILLDGAAFAENLYPHIAFRGVPELRLLVREGDVPALLEAMREERFVPVDDAEPDADAPFVTLYNERFHIRLYTRFLPRVNEDEGLFARAVRAPALGRGVHRLSAEDALIAHALSAARRGFVVPLITYVDLRELVRGASPTAFRGGPGAPIDPAVLRERAKAAGAEKALWAALQVLRFFHPSVSDRIDALLPEVGAAARVVIEKAVVEPAKVIGREREIRGVAELQRLLLS